MTKTVRTLLHFIFCFAPAAAIFALTLEWARPAPAPPTVHHAEPAPADNWPQPVSFSMAPDGTPLELPVMATAWFGDSAVVVDRDSVTLSLYRSGENDSDKAPMTEFLTRRVVTEAQAPFASFDDPLTRSGWVTLGLALVTLTGGFGLFLFQRRLQERM